MGSWTPATIPRMLGDLILLAEFAQANDVLARSIRPGPALRRCFEVSTLTPLHHKLGRGCGLRSARGYLSNAT